MTSKTIDYKKLTDKIHLWASELGFSQLGICDIDLSIHEQYLTSWLENNYHGDMEYMQRHGLKRCRPAELVEGSIRVISVRMDYLPTNAQFAEILKDKNKAYISRYALGRDYHKLMRKKLQHLGKSISDYCEHFSFRAFVDSAPVLERPLAEKAGLGWVGKHSLLLNKEAGSWFFLGELLVDIPLPITKSAEVLESKGDCGNCTACIKICPTAAIVEPFVIDSRRCISYFTIESAAAIPIELRPLMGNRIYGCDDCQLICPWNKFASLSVEKDFQVKNNLDNVNLLELFDWTEDFFLQVLQGSAIRRIGFQSWQRNIAVALGNAPYDIKIVSSLNEKLVSASALVKEHIQWALKQQQLSKHSESESQNSSVEPRDKTQLKLIRTIEKVLPRDA